MSFASNPIPQQFLHPPTSPGGFLFGFAIANFPLSIVGLLKVCSSLIPCWQVGTKNNGSKYEEPQAYSSRGLATQEELPAFCELALDDVNRIGNFGERPLHVAASRGNLEEIAAVLDAGAKLTLRESSA